MSYTIQFAGNILKQSYILQNGFCRNLIKHDTYFPRKGNSYEEVKCSGV